MYNTLILNILSVKKRDGVYSFRVYSYIFIVLQNHIYKTIYIALNNIYTYEEDTYYYMDYMDDTIGWGYVICIRTNRFKHH